MTAKKKAAAPVANMGAGADEQNAKLAEPRANAPSVEERLTALEKAHADHVALAERNGWSV